MAATALITGAHGLLGRHVMAAWNIPGLVALPARGDGRAYDLLDPTMATRMLDEFEPEVVVHLAWVASGTPGYRTSPDNPRWVDATAELASGCLARGVRFVGTGSVVESEIPDPGDLYATAKHAIRARLAADIDSERIAWVQPFYVFDPEVGRPALVADAIRARESGTPVALRSPYSEHDFIHARDVGNAIVATVRAGLVGQIPVGSGRLHRVRDLASALGATWTQSPGSSTTVSHAERAAHTGKLRAAGWRPTSTEEFFGDA